MVVYKISSLKLQNLQEKTLKFHDLTSFLVEWEKKKSPCIPVLTYGNFCIVEEKIIG